MDHPQSRLLGARHEIRLWDAAQMVELDELRARRDGVLQVGIARFLADQVAALSTVTVWPAATASVCSFCGRQPVGALIDGPYIRMFPAKAGPIEAAMSPIANAEVKPHFFQSVLSILQSSLRVNQLVRSWKPAALTTCLDSLN